MRLVYAEVLKVRTAPWTTTGLVLALLGIAALGAGTTGDSADESPVTVRNYEWDLLGLGGISTIFVFILGILIVTWEYRHGTITQTYLATPRRERVVAAKYAVAFVAGGALALLSLVVIVLVASFWQSPDLQRDHFEYGGRLLLAVALWGVFGSGLGAFLQSQVGAIVTAFIWFLIAEPILRSQLEDVGEYFPGAAIERMLDNRITTDESGVRPDYAYDVTAATLIVIAYAAVFGAIGIASAIRRDVS